MRAFEECGIFFEGPFKQQHLKATGYEAKLDVHQRIDLPPGRDDAITWFGRLPNREELARRVSRSIIKVD